MNNANIATMIDHTLLRPDATESEIRALCAEAKEHGFASVCVAPVWVKLAAELLAGSGVKVATVCAFPLGAQTADQKAHEARICIEQGAEEIDAVINIGALKSGDLETVKNELAALRAATEGKGLKIIIETVLLNEAEKRTATRLVVESGADWVKTSTGFAGGGATLADVALMREEIGQASTQIKASGGIRTAADAAAMVEVGATRLGSSAGVALLQ